MCMCVHTCMNSADSHCKDTFWADLTATVEHVRAALCTCICLLGRRRRRGMGHGTGQQGGEVGGKRQGASAWGCTIEKMLKPNQLMLSNFHSQRSTQRLKEAPFGISGSALCCCCTTSNVTYSDDDSWWQRAQRLWAQAELRKQYAHSLFCSLTFLFFGLINDAYKCGLHWWQIDDG